MDIVKDYKKVIEIPLGDVVASPDFFVSVGAIDYGYIIDNGCILPFYIKKKFLFRYMIFSTGILNCSSSEQEQVFLDRLIPFVKESFKIDFILSQHVNALFSIVPPRSQYCLFGSYILDLSLTEDDIWAKMHSKHRNVIRKAEKDGVIITCGDDNKEECIKLVQNTLLRQGIAPINDNVFSNLGNVKYVDYWLATLNNGIEGGAIIYWYPNCGAYYMYGGSGEKPHTGSMNLLQWNVIKKMKENNVKFYDFMGARINPEVGSKYEGIQRFKERFGGELKKGYLWKYSLNDFKYWLYRLLVFVYSKGHFHGDIIDQERKRGNI